MNNFDQLETAAHALIWSPIAGVFLLPLLITLILTVLNERK